MMWEKPERQIGMYVICYRDAISASEKPRQWQKALPLLWELIEKKIESQVVCCSAATIACEKGAQWRMVLALLRGEA